MKSGKTSESGRSFLERAIGWLFDQAHPALHWAIVPMLLGLVLTVALSPVLFLGELLSTGQTSAKTGAVAILFLCGSASIGGLLGGVLFHVLRFRYDLRLICCLTLSGLVAGISMAAGLQFFAVHEEDQVWVSFFFVLGGLLLGLILGLGFAHASRQDAA